jgi:hypothetical protein
MAAVAFITGAYTALGHKLRFFDSPVSDGIHPQMAQIWQIFPFLFCVISEICGWN